VLDVRVDDGVIAALGQSLDTNSHRVIDAEGLVLVPAFVDPHGLQGARIGIPRAGVFDTIPSIVSDVFDAAVAAMQATGATIVDPADIPTIDAINSGSDEITVLLYEFKRDLNAYLATRSGVPIHTLADAIAFNKAHADTELKWFGQELFELAEADLFSDAEYAAALANERANGGPDGIDAALAAANLDALIMPTVPIVARYSTLVTKLRSHGTGRASAAAAKNPAAHGVRSAREKNAARTATVPS